MHERSGASQPVARRKTFMDALATNDLDPANQGVPIHACDNGMEISKPNWIAIHCVRSGPNKQWLPASIY
jgi:hypothetical protein